MPLAAAYASFDPQPVAAASLGQAHRATLSAGIAADTGFDAVVVKVQRPGIEEVVAVDLDALRRVPEAGCARIKLIVAPRRRASISSRSSPQRSLEEIDYLHEAGERRALRRRLRIRRPSCRCRSSPGIARPCAC